MSHERGTEPTPPGPIPDTGRHRNQAPPTGAENEKYVISTPGPDLLEDGAYFFGYNRENAQRPGQKM